MSITLDTILESDVIVVGDYYFIIFEYDNVLNWLQLKQGHCVSYKANKKAIKFDKQSIDNASISGNVVSMFDVKGKKYDLELMDLTPKKI